MSRPFLVLGDHHGGTDSLQRVVDDVADETFDFAVHVGDFTNAMREDRAAAAEQLRAAEPYLEEIAARTRHGLVWVYGNRDLFGDVPYDLDVGTQIPDDGCVTVGGQWFTNSPAAVEDDVILVTHMEKWSLLDHFDGLAHFCGNTHLGRQKGRRVNSAFLQYTPRGTDERKFGGYVVVDVTEHPPFDLEVRTIGHLDRIHCEEHGERGFQFHNAFGECMYCAEPDVLNREMVASAFYGLTYDADRETVTQRELVDYAVDLWNDPPISLRSDLQAYLDDIEDDRYSPLARTDDGRLEVAEESYAY